MRSTFAFVLITLGMLTATGSVFAQQATGVFQATPAEAAACVQELSAFQKCVEEYRKTAKPATQTTVRRATPAQPAPGVIVLQVEQKSSLSPEYVGLLRQVLNANIELSKANLAQASTPESPVLKELLAESRRQTALHERGNQLREEANKLIDKANTSWWVKANTIANVVSAGANIGQLFKGAPDMKFDINNSNSNFSSATGGSASATGGNASASSHSEGGAGGSGGSGGSVTLPPPSPTPHDKPSPPKPPRDDKPRNSDRDDGPPKKDYLYKR